MKLSEQSWQALLIFFSFEMGRWLRWCEEEEWRRQDPGDYTSYYCSCHLFSLALGTFSMATTHSKAIGGDLAVLCISWCTHDEDNLVWVGERSPLMSWLLHFSQTPAWLIQPSLGCVTELLHCLITQIGLWDHASPGCRYQERVGALSGLMKRPLLNILFDDLR